jgi:hypothetical protein
MTTLPPVALFQYLALALLLLLALRCLHAYRGVSLLAIVSLCLGAELGIMYYGCASLGSTQLSDSAVERFGLSLVAAYIILGLFLLLELRYAPKGNITAAAEPARLTAGWRIIAAVLLIGLLVQQFTSTVGTYVLQHGASSLGGSDYYAVRTELIEVEAENLSRFALHFASIARRTVFIALIVAGCELARRKELVTGVLFVFYTAGLALAEATRYQKGPVVYVLAAAALPFLFSKHRASGSVFVVALVRAAAFLLVFMLLGAASLYFTQGMAIEDAAFFVLERFFIIPTSTSCMYFEVYPDLHPFVYWADLRPVREMFGIQHLAPLSGVLSGDVAFLLTGFRYNANASFVAESWAAAGFVGVAVGTVFFAGFCFAVDRFTSKRASGHDCEPLSMYYWLGFTVYGNSAVLYCIFEHGLWLVPFIYFRMLEPRPLAPQGAAAPCRAGEAPAASGAPA